VIIAAVALLVFVLDYATKAAVAHSMIPGESITVIPGVLHLTYVRNAGAAFGLLQHQTDFFIVVTLIVIGLIIVYGRQAARRGTMLALALGLQLGGAVGNLVDRIQSGSVIDFIDFRIWPVFNLADSAIVLGGVLFVIFLLREGRTDAGG
jgi:signal peptidase II